MDEFLDEILTVEGKRNLSTYFTLRADDLVIGSFPEGYKFVISEAETKESDDEYVLLEEFNSDDFNVNGFIKLMMTDKAIVQNRNKEAVIYNGRRIESVLHEWKFEKGYYSHPSVEDLEDMKRYSIEVDGDMGEKYSINFDKNCSVMWLKWSDDGYDYPHKVVNPKQVKSFFENEEFFEKDFIWEYNPTANTYGYGKLQLIVEGEYESYTATCESGSLMKDTVADDRSGGIVHSDPVQEITCTKEDNLVWQPDDEEHVHENIYVEQMLKNGEKNDFCICVYPVGINYSGVIIYEVSAESAKVKREENGSASFLFEQSYDVSWLYNPVTSYTTEYAFPEGYEIKSAEATIGAITVEDRLNHIDGGKCVKWSPDENSVEDAELTIIAIKDGKEVEFRVNISCFGVDYDKEEREYIITPVNCKLTEDGIATYLLEEK